MRYKMSYFFFLIFLFMTIPYLITVSMTIRKEKKEINFETYDSGYKIISGKEEIDLEKYLLEIMPGQISMDYEEETLKAQAVILRTDILRRMGKSKTMKEENLPYQRQSDTELKKALGNKKYEIKDQLRKRCVSDTIGKVLFYGNSLIQPYYHGISVGTTLDAEEWFGKKIPYLKAKDSVRDVEAPEYMTVQNITYGEIVKKLKEKKGKELKVDELKKNLCLKRTTRNGYVKEVQAGTMIVSGELWAEWFHLSSNNFYLEAYDGKVRMICLGKGNGIGFSQYGANEMAKDAKGYEKILKYYYSGIKIKDIYE